MKEHWLARPGTIRLLWAVFLGCLALTVLAELFIDLHPRYRLERTPGFYAWYGFLTCIGMIVIAKLLGFILHRRDDYYDRD